ncbi:hypothetical protein OCU04_007600 [Sclerotinia nivalis]|uniref:Uncharacterized protein n=1 Tax=Sclerotinia nivalis TaxID=352851 RepID=A0A9X0DJB3_9HELO|nr:hypothetical protein OCU04_007600 [Sclerotinia nivalis]
MEDLDNIILQLKGKAKNKSGSKKSRRANPISQKSSTSARPAEASLTLTPQKSSTSTEPGSLQTHRSEDTSRNNLCQEINPEPSPQHVEPTSFENSIIWRVMKFFMKLIYHKMEIIIVIIAVIAIGLYVKSYVDWVVNWYFSTTSWFGGLSMSLLNRLWYSTTAGPEPSYGPRSFKRPDYATEYLDSDLSCPDDNLEKLFFNACQKVALSYVSKNWTGHFILEIKHIAESFGRDYLGEEDTKRLVLRLNTLYTATKSAKGPIDIFLEVYKKSLTDIYLLTDRLLVDILKTCIMDETTGTDINSLHDEYIKSIYWAIEGIIEKGRPVIQQLTNLDEEILSLKLFVGHSFLHMMSKFSETEEFELGGHSWITPLFQFFISSSMAKKMHLDPAMFNVAEEASFAFGQYRSLDDWGEQNEEIKPLFKYIVMNGTSLNTRWFAPALLSGNRGDKGERCFPQYVPVGAEKVSCRVLGVEVKTRKRLAWLKGMMDNIVRYDR